MTDATDPHTSEDDDFARPSDDPSPPGDEGKDKKPFRGRRGNALLRELLTEIELWRGSDGLGYATIEMNGHREHHRVAGETFANWLRLRSQLRGEAMLGNTEVDRLSANLNARCLGLGATYQVCHRVGRHGANLYVDLADADWRAVEIVPAEVHTTDRWRVVDRPPVRFVRPAGMREMPPPAPGGQIDDLRRWLNVETEAHFRLTVAWLLACYRERGPYPILMISSSHGSGKSTLTRLLTRLVDPQQADVRAPAKEERDLWVAAQNARLLAYDNLSAISKDMADAFCRISTGGTFAARTLHSDADETILRACCPMLLNSITEVINRPDMMDRALLVETRHIGEGERRTEDDLWREFAEEEPSLLGAIFDALSAALGAYPETPVPKRLRMADAARWAAAAAPFLNWRAEELADWWRRNRIAGDLSVIESDMVAGELLAHLERQGARWEGTVTELYTLLTDAASEKTKKSRAWPLSPIRLRNQITRLRDPLETKGWAFQPVKGTHGVRKLIFTRIEGVTADEPAA